MKERILDLLREMNDDSKAVCVCRNAEKKLCSILTDAINRLREIENALGYPTHNYPDKIDSIDEDGWYDELPTYIECNFGAMNIQDAIVHCEDVASKCGNKGCASDHLQLKQWLVTVQDLFRLKELIEEANGGWKPDWVAKTDKYVIVQIYQCLYVKKTKHDHSILAFKDIETAYIFRKENGDLIQKVFGFFS